MPQKLLKTAKKLEEDGGHGDKWAVFNDNVEEFIGTAINFAVKNGEVIINETKEDAANTPEGELAACLMHTDCSDGDGHGVNVVLAKSRDFGGDSDNLTLISMFPKFSVNSAIFAKVNLIELFPNSLEARLWLQTDFLPFSVCAFDTDFCANRGKYEVGESYEFHIFALAFSIVSTEGDSFAIDDEHGIRKHRATRAWVEKYGSLDAEKDLEAALLEWEPQTKEDLEPVVFDLSKLSMFMPHDKYADESSYSGEILEVMEPEYAYIFGCNFWQIVVRVSNTDGDRELEIPLFVSKLTMQGYVPKVGDFIKGIAWIGCYLK
jgi:hypothetical protein